MTANVQTLDTMPWYKYPWPWFFLTLLSTVVIAGFITLYIAITKHPISMVEDDYYKRGLAINEDIARDNRAFDLGLTAEAMVGVGEVRVFLNLQGDMPHAEHLRMHFKHATRAGDQSVDLKYEGGFYSGSMEPLSPGKWRLALEDTAGEWRLLSNFDPTKHESVRLLPLPVLATSMEPAD